MGRYTGKPCQNADCGRKKGPRQAEDRYCATCQRDKKKSRSATTHEKRVMDTYGLLEGEYATLYEAQGGTCAICQRSTGASRRLSVDHDHKLEHLNRISVRGLLCRPDNDALGWARDIPEHFLRAAAYLINPPAPIILGYHEEFVRHRAEVINGTA